jgi:predicted RNA binding protein YcfA (HicA-like mRNA interferase family)
MFDKHSRVFKTVVLSCLGILLLGGMFFSSDMAIAGKGAKRRTLIQELLSVGFVLQRTTGGHAQYIHRQTGVQVTVPTANKDGTLSIGVTKDIRSKIRQLENTYNMQFQDPSISNPRNSTSHDEL